VRDDDSDVPAGTGPVLNRREVLTLGAVTAALAGGVGLIPTVAPRSAEALPPPPGEEVIANAYGFGVDIPEAPEASANILAVTLDDLAVTTSSGAAPKRKKVPLPTLHLTVESGTPAASELDLWWQDAAKGKCIRKNITVTLFKSDKSAGRRYNLNDCFPTQWSSVNFDTSSTVQTETLTVKIGRIEFKT
jgi:phage tail-like protein